MSAVRAIAWRRRACELTSGRRTFVGLVFIVMFVVIAFSKLDGTGDG
jgi:hypothetical protein